MAREGGALAGRRTRDGVVVMRAPGREEQRGSVMQRWQAIVGGILGLLFSMASCNQLGGIREGVPRGDDPVVPCSGIEDCAKVEAPECRVPVTCEQGLCTYGNAIETHNARRAFAKRAK